MIPGSANSLLLASAAAEPVAAEKRSLRFNSADTAYLDRTPASAGNRKTWTWSAWIKRNKLNTTQRIFAVTGGASNNDSWFAIGFNTSNQIFLGGYSIFFRTTNAVFRDCSAWLHCVVTIDLNAATTMKIFINGVLQTLTGSSDPTDTGINSALTHQLGIEGSSAPCDLQLADVHFIDGQALDPTSFGEFDATTGVWNPIEYTGSYGTNGFHLDFADNSSVAALGTDTSGNGNDWTVNNLVAGPAASTGFKAVAYTGNGSSQTISGLGFSPDLVWIKNRGSIENHSLSDTVRGVNKQLESSRSIAETSNTNHVTAFNSDGFDVGSSSQVNESSKGIVAWCWDAGSSTVSNTDGTITSSVRANTTTGFSIVTYTGNGTSGATIGHGLGVAPDLVIAKRRSSSNDWWAYHSSLGGTKYLILNLTNAAGTANTIWNDTNPSSTVVTLGGGESNTNTATYVAYCFASKTGISDFGSYTGNGQTLGPTVTTNFRPMLVAIKRTDSTGNWVVFDSARSLDNDLKWNEAEAEGYAPIIFNSDGFQTNYSTPSLNTLNGTYIYAAFAENVNPADIDSLLDSATNGDTANDTGLGGEVPGNYCTANPLIIQGSGNSFANGNLDVTVTENAAALTTIAFDISTATGFYAECLMNTVSANGPFVGIRRADITSQAQWYIGYGAYDYGYAVHNGNKYNNSSSSSYGSTLTAGDILQIAVKDGKIWWGKNGTWFSSGDPAAGTNAAYTGITGNYLFGFSNSAASTVACSWNFGQRPFAYQAPSGFRPLATPFLPTPTIADGSAYMDVKLWTGNGSTQTISGLEFSPDLLWIKGRSAAYDHYVQDAIRGSTVTLETNNAGAETTNSDGVTAFTSDGFSLGAGTGFTAPNVNGVTYVGWSWDGGSSTVSNTDGSITSSVRANASAGFSIVTYTGTGGTSDFGHGLNVKPGLVIIKNRTTAGYYWIVGHSALASNQNLYLNDTIAAQTYTSQNHGGIDLVNSTSSVIELLSGVVSADNVNRSGSNYVAYCFAPVAGYSAFGSYTGNGSPTGDGPFVYTGFRPRWIMYKVYSGDTGHWFIHDTARDPYNQAQYYLRANLSDAEATSVFYPFDILSNGFKIRSSNGNINGNGYGFIWAAFAESPFNYARAS